MSDKGATKINEYVEKLTGLKEWGEELLEKHEHIYSFFYENGKKISTQRYREITSPTLPPIPEREFTTFGRRVELWLHCVYFHVGKIKANDDKDYEIALPEYKKLKRCLNIILKTEGCPTFLRSGNSFFRRYYRVHPVKYCYTHGTKIYETAKKAIEAIIRLIDILQGVRVDSVSESHTTRKIHKGKEEFTGLSIHTPDGTTWDDISFVMHEEWASITVTPRKPAGEKISKPKIAFNKLGFKSNIKLEDGRLVPGYLWGFFINTVAISAEKGYPVPKSQFSKGLKKYTSELRTLLKKIFPDIPYDSYARSVDNPIPYDFGLKKWTPRFRCIRDFGNDSGKFYDWE